jgi:phosphoglycerol transferase MdoB-like AlkP superfamily enzyme
MKIKLPRHRFFLSILPAGYVLLVLCAARLFFFVINYHILPAGNNHLQWFWILWYGLRFDLIISLMILLPLLVIHTMYNKWPALFFRQLVIWLYVIIILAVTTLSFFDAIYFNGNHRRLTAGDLFFVGENKGLLAAYAKKWWYLFIFLVVICFVAHRVAAQWMKQNFFHGATVKYTTGIFISWGVLFFLLVFDFNTRHFFTPSSGYFVMKGENVPFSTNTIAELWASNKYNHLDIAEWKFMSEEQAFATHPVIQEINGKTPNKKNIVLFIIESASREDFLENAQRRVTMPFLDSLMKRSLVFDNFFANGLSSPSGFDAIVGGLPEGYAADFFMTGYGYNKAQWFTGVLKEYGYSTNFFYGVKDFGYSLLKTSKSYQLDNDFGYRNYTANNKDFDGYYGIYDHIFFPVAAHEINKLKEPFLSIVYNVSTHAPYNLIPDSILDRLPVFKKSNGRSLRYYDNVLGSFFSLVKDQQWFANTIFVFVADHFSRAPDAPGKSAVDIYKIPMFIYTPGAAYTGHYPFVAQQIDIPETLLDMTGIKKTFFSYGRSVFDTSQERISFNMNRGIMQAIGDQYVLQYNFIAKKVQGYYDYKNDPLLSANLYAGHTAEADSLLKKLLAFWEVYSITLHDNKMTPGSFSHK